MILQNEVALVAGGTSGIGHYLRSCVQKLHFQSSTLRKGRQKVKKLLRDSHYTGRVPSLCDPDVSDEAKFKL